MDQDYSKVLLLIDDQYKVSLITSVECYFSEIDFLKNVSMSVCPAGHSFSVQQECLTAAAGDGILHFFLPGRL